MYSDQAFVFGDHEVGSVHEKWQFIVTIFGQQVGCLFSFKGDPFIKTSGYFSFAAIVYYITRQ